MAWKRGSAVSVAVLVGLLRVTAPAPAMAEPAPGGESTTVELTVVGGPALNPNTEGRASPVIVRIFDLAATHAFDGADYAALFEQPGDELKRDIAAQEEFVLRPGDIQQHDRNLQPQIQALGVAAAFRDLDHSLWRLTIPVKPGRRNFLLIHLDHDTIRVETVSP